MLTVAALYVDPRGPYSAMSGVDCWDEARDARLYEGPHPIVAHPSCGPWGKMRHLCTQQDPSCGLHAIRQVHMCGGVVEHPAFSRLWDYVGLPKPGEVPDHRGGRTYEVCQVDWGHVARKRTWLYVVGVDQRYVLRRLRERCGTGVATKCISRDARRQSSRLKRATPLECLRTPQPFADFLVALARRVR